MAIKAFLSRSPGLLNWGPGSPACPEHVLHSSISSPTNLNFLSPGLYNNLTPTLLPASVTISHSVQPLDSQGHILIFLDQMHLLFTQVHFLFWQLSRVGGQYTTLYSSHPFFFGGGWGKVLLLCRRYSQNILNSFVRTWGYLCERGTNGFWDEQLEFYYIIFRVRTNLIFLLILIVDRTFFLS